MDEASNDDLVGHQSGLLDPDPHGQAAILLVESLVHSLIAKSVLSLDEAVESVEVAVDVATEMAIETGSLAGRRTITLLSAIGVSLQRDLPNDDPVLEG